jgi:chaperonin GroES
MKTKPFHDLVIISQHEKESVSKGGIILPEQAQAAPDCGKVVAVGPGRIDDNGERIRMSVKKGETVRFAGKGYDFEEDGETYIVLREAEIIGTVE